MTAIAARVGGINWTHPKTVGIFGIALGALAYFGRRRQKRAQAELYFCRFF